MKKLFILAAIVLVATLTVKAQFEAKKIMPIGVGKVPGVKFYELYYSLLGTDTTNVFKYLDVSTTKEVYKTIAFKGGAITIDALYTFLSAELQKDKGNTGDFTLGESSLSYKVAKSWGEPYLEVTITTGDDQSKTRFSGKLLNGLFGKESK